MSGGKSGYQSGLVGRNIIGGGGMTKQEEIREGIASSLASIDGYEWETLAGNLKSVYLHNAGTVAYNLHSQGVVIQVVPDDSPQIYRAVESLI